MSDHQRSATRTPADATPLNRRGPLHAWQQFLTHYLDFRGRSTRPEFWWWFLTFTVVSLVLSLINKTYIAPPTTTDSAAILNYTLQVSELQLLWTALNFIGAAALTVRRLHDTGRSGWWWFIQLVPLAGAIIMIILVALPTTPDASDSGSR